MQWLRLYHDTPNDPKWRLIAAESGQCEGLVLAVWVHMMVCASAAKDRGRLDGWDDRVVAASMGVKCAVVTAIREAMQGVTLDGDVLTGWEKRQRIGDDAAAKKRKQRAQKHQSPPDGGGDGGRGTEEDKTFSNGHVPGQFADVPGQTADVPRQSQDSPGTFSKCPEIPLYLYSSANSYSPAEESSLAPPIGGAGKKVVYQGVNLHLGAQRLSEWQKRYSAIPDFMATLQTVDAGLDGCKNPLGEAQRQLLNQHLYWTKHDPKKPQAKAQPKPHTNRAGIRRLGGSNAA
jgi:hypothetical protein